MMLIDWHTERGINSMKGRKGRGEPWGIQRVENRETEVDYLFDITY